MALSATFSRFLVHAANAPLGEPNHGQTAHAILCNVVRAIFARGEEKFGSIETAFLCALGEYIARAEVTVAEYFIQALERPHVSRDKTQSIRWEPQIV